MPLSRGLVPLVMAAAIGAGPIAAAHAAKDDLFLVNRASGPAGAPGDQSAYAASTSADGRFVAFESRAGNLSDEDKDGVSDVFVRDLRTRSTMLVSRGSKGVIADANSFAPAISADGRFVAFESAADNLTGDDDDGVVDIFVRDLEAGTTVYVSRTATGGAADGDSLAPAISADGRFVAFSSDADNMSTEDEDGRTDVFVRDSLTNTTTYVSRASAIDGAKGSDGARAASISGDGRFVAFQSTSDELSDEDDDAYTNIFVRDLQTHTTIHASRAGDGTGADGESSSASISADGRVVAFESGADNLSGEDSDPFFDVFVHDLQSGITTYASRAGGASGDDDSFSPSISADGRFVAFRSAATNLSGEDDDALRDVFVRDLHANTTTLVSRAGGATGVPGNGNAGEAAISSDGRFVAFSSPATNLSGEDDDNFENVFLRDVLGEPTPIAPPAPAAAAPDTTGPRLLASALARANRAVRVSRRGRFRLFCGRYAEPVTGTCRVRKVASRSFTAKAGRRVTARFRLSPSGFRTLKTNQKLRARATVLARDSLGNPTTVRFHVTLKAPKAHR